LGDKTYRRHQYDANNVCRHCGLRVRRHHSGYQWSVDGLVWSERVECTGHPERQLLTALAHNLTVAGLCAALEIAEARAKKWELAYERASVHCPGCNGDHL